MHSVLLPSESEVQFNVHYDTLSLGSQATANFEGDVWLSRSDGHVAVMSCNQHGWLDYKVSLRVLEERALVNIAQNILVNEDAYVTAVCLVDETVWLGEITGMVRVFW